MGLAEAFAQEAAQRKDNDWIAELGRVAKAAMMPWDLGKVTVYIDDNSRSARTVWFEFEKLPGYPFRYQFDEWQMMHAFDLKAYFTDSVRQPLFEHIRYRAALTVDDHIILGED
jgi:hypothetical protein